MCDITVALILGFSRLLAELLELSLSLYDPPILDNSEAPWPNKVPVDWNREYTLIFSSKKW